jgi:hypothetical protein
MDADRFDNLLRSLARSWPRRSVTRSLPGLVLAGTLLRDPFAAEANRKKKKKRERKKDRKKGECSPRCAGGTLCCDGRCVNVVTDRGNCGACGTQCGAAEQCRNAECVPCDNPFALCTVAGAEQCVDVRTDRNNCGSCGTICPKDPQNTARDYLCQAGQCVCTGTVCPNGRCCPVNFAVCVGDGAACCPTDFPVSCPSGICCPAGYGCGGSCGQDCCR